MILRNLFLIALVLNCFPAISQENKNVSAIPESLKENANAIVRLERTEITISSRKSMTVKRVRTVTVLNEKGLVYMDASEYFDNSTKIKSIEALIYNGAGQEIKKIKSKDFREQSVTEGSILTDNRIIYLDYTPVQYPFTIVYSSVKESSNTAFIPQWSPVEGLYVATEKSSVSIMYDKTLGFKYKDYNFGPIALKKEEQDNKLTLSAENIPAAKAEAYSPSLYKVRPHVLFGLDKFHLEGVDGEAADWASFGAWMYNSLLTGTDELPKETVAKIQSLTANETDLIKKAKIVYEYVQGKTRYISVQLGIGGWKPMKAKDVDRLGYGDCKALTNYTRSLLNAVGVESYYTIVYGDNEKRDIRQDFVSMQGNHAILAIPVQNKITWLECTSQTAPFGFQGNFTDDRTALLIKPDKGELVKTRQYETGGNTQFCTGSYSISENGKLSGQAVITSRGIQYDDKYYLESKPAYELDKIYKSRFGNINNIKFTKKVLTNNKDTQEFTEDIALDAEAYGNKSGNRIIFAVNAFNQSINMPQRYRNRTNPFVIERGFYDADEITIALPEGFTVEAKPENITLTDKFGEYKAEYIFDNANKLVYKRSLKINDGYYESAEYENYRDFREKIARSDNAKIVLAKN